MHDRALCLYHSTVREVTEMTDEYLYEWAQ